VRFGVTLYCGVFSMVVLSLGDGAYSATAPVNSITVFDTAPGRDTPMTQFGFYPGECGAACPQCIAAAAAQIDGALAETQPPPPPQDQSPRTVFPTATRDHYLQKRQDQYAVHTYRAQMVRIQTLDVEVG